MTWSSKKRCSNKQKWELLVSSLPGRSDGVFPVLVHVNIVTLDAALCEQPNHYRPVAWLVLCTQNTKVLWCYFLAAAAAVAGLVLLCALGVFFFGFLDIVPFSLFLIETNFLTGCHAWALGLLLLLLRLLLFTTTGNGWRWQWQ